VFALETIARRPDGYSAARIEEEVVGHRQGLPASSPCSRRRTYRSPTGTKEAPRYNVMRGLDPRIHDEFQRAIL